MANADTNPGSYFPSQDRFWCDGRHWPNTDEGWSRYLDGIHDATFWPSCDELDAWDAQQAWQRARAAWTEAHPAAKA